MTLKLKQRIVHSFYAGTAHMYLSTDSAPTVTALVTPPFFLQGSRLKSYMKVAKKTINWVTFTDHV